MNTLSSDFALAVFGCCTHQYIHVTSAIIIKNTKLTIYFPGHYFVDLADFDQITCASMISLDVMILVFQ